MRSASVLGFAASALAAPSMMERATTCMASYDGTFGITVFKVSKRDVQPRAGGELAITLKDGVLKDSKGRIGNIVANYQFQFDPAPGQPDAVETDDFSICSNGALAHKGDTQWYQCLSGDFNNLYSKNWAAQCEPVQIFIQPISGTGSGSGSAGQAGDGQVQQPTGATQIGDGQVQAPTNVPVTQIGDGQIQAPTGAPVSQIDDGQVQVPSSVAVVTQIGDGQVQAPTGAPATQIGDGQVQAPTGAPVTQIGDGQVQAPTGAPVTQIGDGQVQAPTSAPIVPTPTPSQKPPASAGSHVIPGTVALFIAAIGAVMVL